MTRAENLRRYAETLDYPGELFASIRCVMFLEALRLEYGI